MPIATFKRNELKFLLTTAQAGEFLKIIPEYMVPDKYCRNSESYNIYNIYYDTEDNRLIRTSLAHPYYKEKLRLRSYLLPVSPGQEVYLELKKKIGGIVSKRRTVMPLQEAASLLQSGQQPAGLDYINRQVANEIEYFLSQNKVRPAVFIAYKRIAYFGKDDKNFRITLDRDIVTRREDVCFEKGSSGARLLDENQCLMEVKIPDSAPKWLADTLSKLEIYVTGFSKYGTEYTAYRRKAALDLESALEKEIISLNTGILTNQYMERK